MTTRRCALAVLTVLILMLPGAVAAAPTPTLEGSAEHFGAIPWELPEDAEKLVVESVVDGDTVRLRKPDSERWESYRIIGIQAPEMEGPFTDEECYGPEAKKYLQELLPRGTEVLAQLDISDKDRNGRFLRHLFLVNEQEGGTFLVSEILVLGGYAKARSYPPDDLYDDILAEAQRQARQQDEGLWDACAA